jgi:anti-sigma factor RsiW
MNDDRTHRYWQESLGAYLVGALSSADRAETATHLAGCAECQAELAALAPLPALVAASDPPGAPVAAPRSVLAGLLAEAVLRRQRRRRRIATAIGSATATLAVAASAAVLLAAGPSTPVVRHLLTSTAATSEASGQVALTAKPWGTQLVLQVSHLPTARSYAVYVTGPAGVRELAGRWALTPHRDAVVIGASDFAPSQVVRVDVVTDSGAPVAAGTV